MSEINTELLVVLAQYIWRLKVIINCCLLLLNGHKFRKIKLTYLSDIHTAPFSLRYALAMSWDGGEENEPQCWVKCYV